MTDPRLENRADQPTTAPTTRRTLTFQIGGLKLMGASAALATLGLVVAVVALLYWARPTGGELVSLALWIGFVVYWSVAAKNASTAKTGETRESRKVHEILLVLSFVLLAIPFPGLAGRILPPAIGFTILGLVIQVASLALAVWARRHLGRNWSGAVTVTVDHQLVRSGPYGLVRHPIYTAMLGMFLGTAFISGTLHAFLGFALLAVAYTRKIRIEERTLVGAFGKQYDAYRATTWGLLPRTATILLLATLFIGTCDILFAIIFWRSRGVTPMRIFQSISAGLYGKAAFTGGLRTAEVGAGLHYFISFCIALVYYLASRTFRPLMRRPTIYGSIYGVLVYLVMNYIVIPLSATKRGPFQFSWVAWSIVVHAFLIGVPAAFAARAALRPESDRAPT